MNIYLIKRDNPAEYDETVAAVIVAESYGAARKLAETLPGDQDNTTAWNFDNADITRLDPNSTNAAYVVLSQYNAS